MRPLDPRVLPHLRPAAAPLVITTMASAAGGLLLVAQAFAVATLLTALVQHAAWQQAAWWLVGISISRALIGWVGDVAASRAAGRVATTMRRRLLHAAFALDATSLSRRRTGELALLATRGVAAVEPYVTRYLPALVVAVVLPPLTLVAIATQDLWAAVVVTATLPLVPLFSALIGLSTKARAERQWRALSSLSGHFVDVVRGLPTLVAFNRAQAQSATVRAITHRYRRASAATLRLAFASSGVLELVATLSVALVAVTVGLRLAAAGLELRTALVVLLLAPEAYWPLRRVGAEFHAAAEGTATFEHIHELIGEAPEASPAGSSPGRQPGTAPPRLELRGLSLGYGTGPPVLGNLTARIPSRALTAIVGPSGCGKSTLLAALIGELAPAAGRVLVDGRDLDAPAIRPQVAFVPQRPWLVEGTVADNVRIGHGDADDAAVWQALHAVALGDTVAALPRGLDTPLGEDGAELSAGQQVRLALARVLVSRRPLVVLDEPTAHLDAETETVLLRTLTRLARSCTVVVVAHRQAVAAAADHVVELPAHEPRADRPTGAAVNVDHHTPIRMPDEPPSPARHGPQGLGPLLAVLASASGVALTATAGWLIVRASQHPPVLMLMVAIIAVRTFGLARPVFRYAERLVSHDSVLVELADRRARIYDLLVPLVPGRVGRRGELLAAVVDDVDALVDRRLRVRLPVLTWLGVVALAAGTAVLVEPVAAAVIAALALAGGAAAWWCGRCAARRHGPAYVTARGLLARQALAVLTSARQLVLWQRDQDATETVTATSDAVAASATASARGQATGGSLALLLGGLGTALVAAIVAGPVDSGLVSGPMAALLMLLPLALVDVTAPLADAGALSVRCEAALRRLDAFAVLAPAVTEPAAPTRPAVAPPDLRLDDVTTGWDGRPVISSLDVTMPPGARLGVVGPSGCGKSTLAALLMRFLAPVDGAMLLGGTDVSDLGGAEVRRHVALVPDETYLFSSTLRENLRLARPDATDTDVTAALVTAGLGNWLAGLAHGLDTMLGDGHTAVSGGEQTRIGIARALLARAEVLVLDEPTAHLDTATARAVTDQVLAAVDGRSLVWVTHGTVGLDRMDEVLSLAHAPTRRSGTRYRGAVPQQRLEGPVDVGALPGVVRADRWPPTADR